jgi:crotonobetainyl-CoA:carnitine CoA-transferase CaiB-like acyl-CoA transferase
MMPLKGIRVVDISRLAPGPYCSMLLGDLGADVILVEEPPGLGRFMDRDADDRARAFNALRRNKRSVVLNLKDEGARRAFYRLVETADVLLEGFRPGVVRRLGVDYETVTKLNPRLVYCSLTGYGQDGPYADLVGHDINYISMGGALGIIGWPGSPPAIPMNLLADYAGGGLYAAFSILAALMARQNTGRGQHVDIAMADGVLSLLTMAAGQFIGEGLVPRGGQHVLTGSTPYYNVYETADGRWLSIGCIEPYFWEKLCQVLGCPQFIPHQLDLDKFPEIFAFFREKFRTRKRDEWFQEMRQVGDICVAPVYSLDEVFTDPHVQARGMVADVAHPELGPLRQVGVAAKLSDTPGAVRWPGPGRGAHTEEVLLSLGYSAREVAALRAAGAIV